MLGQGHAPADVPVNHWAYNAVDELFEAGILQGYSATRGPFVRKKVASDTPGVIEFLMRLRHEGALVGLPDPSGHHSNTKNPYQQGVALHAAWSNITAESNRRDALPYWLPFLPKLANAINMRTFELERMGANVDAMLERLNGIAKLPLHLPIGAEPEEDFLGPFAKEVVASGLVKSYPDDGFRTDHPMSNYEEAVLFHAAAVAMSSDGAKLDELELMPKLVLAMGMRSKELARMGVDVQALVNGLNARRNALFQITYQGGS